MKDCARPGSFPQSYSTSAFIVYFCMIFNPVVYYVSGGKAIGVAQANAEERRFSLLTDSLIGQQRIVIWSKDQKRVTNDAATHEYLILRIDRFECPF